MNSKCVKTGLFQTNCYIVEDFSKEESFIAIIDPGSDANLICDALNDASPTHIILTHAHFDHVGALMALHEIYPKAKIAIGKNENFDLKQVIQEAKYVLGPSFSYLGLDNLSLPSIDILLDDKDTIGPFEVIFTPGHTSGSICLYNREENVLFSGDTLFFHSYGRTDINGNQKQIEKSLIKLLSLNPKTIVFPGHDRSTTIEAERLFFNYLLN